MDRNHCDGLCVCVCPHFILVAPLPPQMISAETDDAVGFSEVSSTHGMYKP